MKVKLLLNRENPKVPRDSLSESVKRAGLSVTIGKADVGVVVGGDGVFGLYGRTEDIPLLFVGVKSDGPTGSKAHLAGTYYDELLPALEMVASGDYRVVEYRRLEVLKGGRTLGETFTDAYLQRGADSNCIRYSLAVDGPEVRIRESAIGDGLVVCTRAGSTGYYSYPDKLRGGEWMDTDRYSVLPEDRVGVCHILPTYTEREGTKAHPLRYTVPWGSEVKVALARPADARLYGLGYERSGFRVAVKDQVTIRPSARTTKVIQLGRR